MQDNNIISLGINIFGICVFIVQEPEAWFVCWSLGIQANLQ